MTKTERRVRLRCVSACDIRVTPAGRLLRRYPVFIAAGSFTGGEVPLFVVKKGQEARVEALLPGYSKPDGPLCDPARKSPVQYFGNPAPCWHWVWRCAALPSTFCRAFCRFWQRGFWGRWAV